MTTARNTFATGDRVRVHPYGGGTLLRAPDPPYGKYTLALVRLDRTLGDVNRVLAVGARRLRKEAA